MPAVSAERRTCKDICKRYKAKKPHGVSRYALGQIRCHVCAIFMTRDGSTVDNRCVCCNYMIRTKPRGTKYKELYHAATGTGNAIE